VAKADAAASRSKGLLGRASLHADEGLWIVPCPMIHTFFMKFPIDVIFLRGDLSVARVIEDMKPWRLSPWCSRAQRARAQGASCAARCARRPAGTEAVMNRAEQVKSLMPPAGSATRRARRKENPFSHILNAVESRATFGEIFGAPRGIFGEYHVLKGLQRRQTVQEILAGQKLLNEEQIKQVSEDARRPARASSRPRSTSA